MDVGRLRDVGQIATPCPECGGTLVIDDVQVGGTPILVDCTCPSCDVRYWLDWPAGHALLHPPIVRQDTGAVFHDGSQWYARAFVRCLATRSAPVTPPIDVRRSEPRSDTAILVNCVDYLYGHCLLKLFSCLHHLRERPHADVVVIVPRRLTWLVPDAVRSVIDVDIPLGSARGWIGGLDDAVDGVLSGYDTVIVAAAPSQPPISAEDLAVLGPGFEPQRFWGDESDRPPQVTFVLREDRLWIDDEPLRFRVRRRLSPARSRQRLDVARQNLKVGEVASRVLKHLPGTRLVGIGIGSSSELPDTIDDLRSPAAPGVPDEHTWLREYAQSRVVVGVHGSHMLLPSAVAGAVVDLVPTWKLPDVAQDLVIASGDDCEPKLTLFRYRLLPLETSPRSVADAIVSIIEHAAFHHRNMVENRAAETTVGHPRPITWRPLIQ
jgi:hypothetical protein